MAGIFETAEGMQTRKRCLPRPGVTVVDGKVYRYRGFYDEAALEAAGLRG